METTRVFASTTSMTNKPPSSTELPQLIFVPLQLIDPDPNQPRKDLGHLSDLALSIRQEGLVCPLVVESMPTGRYRLLAGARRYAACTSLGWAAVPCIARSVTEQSRLTLQLIENLHRKDLHPVEKAAAFKRLMDEFGLTQRDLARRLGLSLGAVNETLRILDINPEVLVDVRTSEHSNKSVLLEIAKEPDPAQQKVRWDEARARPTTVRQIRAARSAAKSNREDRSASRIELADATVTVGFNHGEPTQERVVAALAAAMATLAPEPTPILATDPDQPWSQSAPDR
jgi:ParB/RepB/Spo0J family partition protein